MKDATPCLPARLLLVALALCLPAPAAADDIDLNALTARSFKAKEFTPAQLTGLLAKWLALEPAKPAPPEKLRSIYARLNDDSYKVREAASAKLQTLGPANLKALVALLAKEQDPETKVRAEIVIAAWKRQAAGTDVLYRNVVAAWGALPAADQLRHARPLVRRIQRLPAYTIISTPKPVGPNGGIVQVPTIDGTIETRLRDPLLRQIATKVHSHKTPEAGRVLKGFLAEPNRTLVLRTMQLIGSPRSWVDVAGDLIRLAEGKDKVVALKALSYLSNWSFGLTAALRAEITVMLKRLYAHPDAEIALQAAIISCYCGDGSGFPMILEATKSPNKAIAMKAIGQLADTPFRWAGTQVVPLLLPHLKTDDINLLSRTIETLGNYPGSGRHIIPFLTHKEKRIVYRTILALNSMQSREAIPALQKLLQESSDKAARNYAKEALRRLQRKPN